MSILIDLLESCKEKKLTADVHAHGRTERQMQKLKIRYEEQMVYAAEKERQRYQ
jgi:hypothetical protein